MGKAINAEMVTVSYDYAKKIYKGQIDQDKALNYITTSSDMDRGSALTYVYVFKHMMEGSEYRRTMNTAATRYYLSMIFLDFGENQLINAISAVRQHVEYYRAQRNGNLRAIESLVREFESSLS
ncbi:hypothetical protein [Paenibacillus sp. NPDC058174]|uniref:hypothetical protein n=1 Tax=Paenibacillus sp. NPDC058174 TaxID=3346366 RepID=UPI0036DED8FD